MEKWRAKKNKQVGKVEEKEIETDSVEAKPEEAESSGIKAKEEEIIASI